MKLKYLFLAFVASAAFVTACDDDVDISSLDDFKVDQSYIGFGLSGGTITSNVTASNSWSFDTASIPEWLTVSPTSGSAGASTISFTVPANEDPAPRTLELKVTVGGETQIFTVYQEGAGDAPLSTISEVLNGSDGTTYRVSGTVSAISNTEYGNLYLEDGSGNQIYVYGLYNSKGQYPKDAEGKWDGFGIAEGDVLVVQGPRSTYNTTIELVNASLISVTKSLIKVTSDPVEIPIEGGSADITVESSGDGIEVVIPDDAKSWLSVTGINTATGTVTLTATENTGGNRVATLTFKTSSGGTEYSAFQEVSQVGHILEVSIADFNAAAVGPAIYRVSGVVSSVDNASRGRFHIKDWSGETYVYNFSGFADSGIGLNDIVTLTGKRDQYGETIELTSASAEKVTKVTPVSIADFLTKEDSEDVYYLVSGEITKIDNATYGNLHLKDGDSELYVYGCYPGYGATGDNRKDFLAKAGIAVGDSLKIIGYKTTYRTTVELSGGIYVSHVKGVGPATMIDETFATSQGSFTINDIALPEGGTYVWKHDDRSYMKASAYINKTNKAAQSRLESPVLNLTGRTKATLSFQHTGKYFGTQADEIKVQYTIDGTTWNDAVISAYPSGNNWNFVDATVDLSAAAGNSSVKFGFLYTSTTNAAPTWEIKNVKFVVE